MKQGEFDDELKWPFRGDITIQLQSQKDHEEYITQIIQFNDGVTGNADGRVIKGKQTVGWDIFSFISHSDLQPKYLKDDCLKLYVHIQN